MSFDAMKWSVCRTEPPCRHRANPNTDGQWCYECGSCKVDHYGHGHAYVASPCGCGHSRKMHRERIGRDTCPENDTMSTTAFRQNGSHVMGHWPICQAYGCLSIYSTYKICSHCDGFFTEEQAVKHRGFQPTRCGCGHSTRQHKDYIGRELCFPDDPFTYDIIEYNKEAKVGLTTKNTIPATTTVTQEQKTINFTLPVANCNGQPITATAQFQNGELAKVAVNDPQGYGTAFQTTDHIRQAAQALTELADAVDANAFQGSAQQA
jgi:hypothetical protein